VLLQELRICGCIRLQHANLPDRRREGGFGVTAVNNKEDEGKMLLGQPCFDTLTNLEAAAHLPACVGVGTGRACWVSIGLLC
jgi:hypothetical protein